MQLLIYTYLFVVNIITFVTYAIDKRYAMENHSRIPNATLIALAWIGGAYGALMGMLLFRHKTRTAMYWVNVLLALLVWLAIVIILRLI